MKLKFIDKIKKLEGDPKVIKLFSNKEIESLLDLYNALPITTYNKKHHQPNFIDVSHSIYNR